MKTTAYTKDNLKVHIEDDINSNEYYYYLENSQVQMIPKKGNKIKHHFAFKTTGESCKIDKESKGKWHLMWQSFSPADNIEVRHYDENHNLVHIADYEDTNNIIEFQSSKISSEKISQRESYYGDKLMWLFNYTDVEFDNTNRVIKDKLICFKIPKGKHFMLSQNNKRVFYDTKSYIIKFLKKEHDLIIGQVLTYKDFISSYMINKRDIPVELNFDFIINNNNCKWFDTGVILNQSHVMGTLLENISIIANNKAYVGFVDTYNFSKNYIIHEWNHIDNIDKNNFINLATDKNDRDTLKMSLGLDINKNMYDIAFITKLLSDGFYGLNDDKRKFIINLIIDNVDTYIMRKLNNKLKDFNIELEKKSQQNKKCIESYRSQDIKPVVNTTEPKELHEPQNNVNHRSSKIFNYSIYEKEIEWKSTNENDSGINIVKIDNNVVTYAKINQDNYHDLISKNYKNLYELIPSKSRLFFKFTSKSDKIPDTKETIERYLSFIINRYINTSIKYIWLSHNDNDTTYLQLLTNIVSDIKTNKLLALMLDEKLKILNIETDSLIYDSDKIQIAFSENSLTRKRLLPDKDYIFSDFFISSLTDSSIYLESFHLNKSNETKLCYLCSQSFDTLFNIPLLGKSVCSSCKLTYSTKDLVYKYTVYIKNQDNSHNYSDNLYKSLLSDFDLDKKSFLVWPTRYYSKLKNSDDLYYDVDNDTIIENPSELYDKPNLKLKLTDRSICKKNRLIGCVQTLNHIKRYGKSDFTIPDHIFDKLITNIMKGCNKFNFELIDSK